MLPYYLHLGDLPPIPRDLLVNTPLGACWRLTKDMGYGHTQRTAAGEELHPVSYIINEFTSPDLVGWIKEHIAASDHFASLDLDPIKLQTQQPQPNLRGSHPVHSDIGREWVLFYLIRPGGRNIKTRWYQEQGRGLHRAKSGPTGQSDEGYIDYKNLTELAEVEMQPENWYILNVSILHDVQGIEATRQSLRLHCHPKTP
jgi:hypothetical protein